tara:strand:- start:172 stop:450 length:279 start_codon:yes stop_codon:yes gene_type:complete
MHFIGTPFEPFKKPLYPIPFAILPRVLGTASLSIEDPTLLFTAQVRKRAVEVQASAGSVEFEISLALLSSFTLKGLYAALVNGARMVWNRLL